MYRSFENQSRYVRCRTDDRPTGLHCPRNRRAESVSTRRLHALIGVAQTRTFQQVIPMSNENDSSMPTTETRLELVVDSMRPNPRPLTSPTAQWFPHLIPVERDRKTGSSLRSRWPAWPA